MKKKQKRSVSPVNFLSRRPIGLYKSNKRCAACSLVTQFNSVNFFFLSQQELIQSEFTRVLFFKIIFARLPPMASAAWCGPQPRTPLLRLWSVPAEARANFWLGVAVNVAVTNLLCAQANSASYPQRDGK